MRASGQYPLAARRCYVHELMPFACASLVIRRRRADSCRSVAERGRVGADRCDRSGCGRSFRHRRRRLHRLWFLSLAATAGVCIDSYDDEAVWKSCARSTAGWRSLKSRCVRACGSAANSPPRSGSRRCTRPRTSAASSPVRCAAGSGSNRADRRRPQPRPSCHRSSRTTYFTEASRNRFHYACVSLRRRHRACRFA